MKARRWSELSQRQQTALLVAVSVQLALAATAWTDLATRSAALVNGHKAIWAAIIGVNFLGPIAYFAWGRRVQPRMRLREGRPTGRCLDLPM